METPRFCCYCGHVISPDADAQWVDVGLIAHTDCAWANEDAYWEEKENAHDHT